MKIWRPKDSKAIAIIKLTLWSAVIVWMVFTAAYAVIAARRLGEVGIELFGDGVWGHILTYVAPAWVIFVTLMLIWAVARFVYRRFKKTTQ